jgi:hypothetical protein
MTHKRRARMPRAALGSITIAMVARQPHRRAALRALAHCAPEIAFT